MYVPEGGHTYACMYIKITRARDVENGHKDQDLNPNPPKGD